MSICGCDPYLPLHVKSDHEPLESSVAPPKREGWVLVPVAKAVSEEVEKHRDEVERRCMAAYAEANGWRLSVAESICHEYRDGIEAALDCLIALCEGREWPGGEK